MRYSLITLGIAAIIWTSVLVQAQQEDAKFVAVEWSGVKAWQGGGIVNLDNRIVKSLTFKVVNPLGEEHGFAIDTMKVKEVIKPGEEKNITAPIDITASVVEKHRVYCHLHPEHHGAATFTVIGLFAIPVPLHSR